MLGRRSLLRLAVDAPSARVASTGVAAARRAVASQLRPMSQWYSMRATAGLAAPAVRSAFRSRRYASTDPTANLRNFGISAHIDSGKTTLTERILFYTGRINKIHEVRGRDGVGATMDSMQQERERGITIKSAATFAQWNDYWFNIIDTPGHVDFTVEVERSLRVLDGGILVLCAAGGVQSQTVTVDRQMKRYDVPRVIFINKYDRREAKEMSVLLEEVRTRLGLTCAAVQLPIGSGASPRGLEGVVDLIKMKAFRFTGDSGKDVEEFEIPEETAGPAKQARQELIETLADVDETVGERFLSEEEPTNEELIAAIRKSTIARTFCPVFAGSARANVGVQLLLDGVGMYLPSPGEVVNHGITVTPDGEEEQVVLANDSKKDLVAMAFKLEPKGGKTLSYCRIYQGTLKKGDTVRVAPRGSSDWKSAQTGKVTRVVRMHSNSMEDVDRVGSGEICAIEGLQCSSGDTLLNASQRTLVSCESIFVPEPVISLNIRPADQNKVHELLEAMKRFAREDPTFRMGIDEESGEMTISGMGELHLEIYRDRVKIERGIEVISGSPFVQFREYFPGSCAFDHRHKKQSGGRGQFAQLSGNLSCLTDISLSTRDTAPKNEFVANVAGGALTEGYQKAIQKAFNEVCEKGPLFGAPVWGLRMELTGGQMHDVDSSEFVFALATRDMLTQAFESEKATLLEPVMSVEVIVPRDSQQDVLGVLSERMADVGEQKQTLVDCTIMAEVTLRKMFGFIGDLRNSTKGLGEFSMEYSHHQEVPFHEASVIVRDRLADLKSRK